MRDHIFYKMMFFVCISVVFFSPQRVLASATEQGVPVFAVLPFISEKDPSYGVFIADLLVAELLFYRNVPGWQKRRFEVVEPDTLAKSVQMRILDTDQAIRGKSLEKLRMTTRADFVVLGRVIDAGTKRLSIRMVNTKDGSITWTAKAQDDIKWVWIYPQRQVGEIVIGQITSQMGFSQFDRRAYNLKTEEIPKRVATHPFYADQKALVTVYERKVREGVAHGGLFDLIRIDSQEMSRLGLGFCQSLRADLGVDAVLYGSFMVSGKDESTNNATVILRLIETEYGRIVWSGKASGRRVWRKDDFDEMAEVITADLLTQLANARNQAVLQQFVDIPEPEDGIGWVALGSLYLEQGLLETAEEAFLKAEAYPDAQALAFQGLGKVYARRPGQRQTAITYFQQAVQIDSVSAEPYFLMAQSYVEMEIGLAVDMAEKALERDPNYSAAYLLIADWFARGDWYATRDEDEVAANHYRHYLRLVPNDLEAAQRFGRVLLRQKNYADIERYILPLLNNPDNVTALLPIAAQWATSVKEYDRANVYWADFLSRVHKNEVVHYNLLTPILPKEAVNLYLGLGDDDRVVFEDDFWQRRDPDPTTAVNERLLEHYGRVFIARQSFAEVSYPWDRRGEVFIRYGRPDYRSRSNRVPSLVPLRVEQIKERIYSEIYSAPPTSELVGTVFPVRSSRAMMADERFGVTMDNANTFVQGDGFMPVTGAIDHSLVPWESWVYTEIGGGIEITFTDEMGAGRFDFAPIPAQETPGIRSVNSVMANAPEVVFERAAQERPDFYNLWANVNPVEFYYDLATFKHNVDASLFNVFFGVPLDKENRNVLTQRDTMELAIAMVDSASLRVYRTQTKYDKKELASLSVDGNMFIDLLGVDVVPGRYRLTTKVAQEKANAMGVFLQTVDVVDYAAKQLKISDFILASQMEEAERPGRFTKHNINVLPRPSRMFVEGQQMGVYFEAYNLERNEFGQTSYEVTIQILSEKERGGVSQFFRGRGEKAEVALTFSQTGNDNMAPIHLFVDLKNIATGKNLLHIMLRDRVSGEEVYKEGVFYYKH